MRSYQLGLDTNISKLQKDMFINLIQTKNIAMPPKSKKTNQQITNHSFNTGSLFQHPDTPKTLCEKIQNEHKKREATKNICMLNKPLIYSYQKPSSFRQDQTSSQIECSTEKKTHIVKIDHQMARRYVVAGTMPPNIIEVIKVSPKPVKRQSFSQLDEPYDQQGTPKYLRKILEKSQDQDSQNPEEKNYLKNRNH